MSTKAVSIDLRLALDPYKMLFLIAGLGAAHDEIFVPDTLRFVETWAPTVQPCTIKVFEDPAVANGELARAFGYDSGLIKPDNFCAGLRLLRRAHDKGMITLLSTFDGAYQREGLARLNTKLPYPDMYPHFLPSGERITINPDNGGATLEALLGLEVVKGVRPIFGDVEFLDYVRQTITPDAIKGSLAELEVDKGLQILLNSPQATDFEELWWYAENKKAFEEISAKLKQAENTRSLGKDISLVGLKFTGTFIADATLFAGVPVTSGMLAVYEIGERILRARKSRPS